MGDALPLMLLSFFTLAATIYLVVRSIFDWRAGKLAWAICGTIIAVFGLVTLLIPIKTHAVKIDLPLPRN